MSERVPLMEALIRDMRRNPDWSKTRADFRGAVILARIAPSAAVLLKRFLESPVFERTPPWVGSLVRDEAWFKS